MLLNCFNSTRQTNEVATSSSETGVNCKSVDGVAGGEWKWGDGAASDMDAIFRLRAGILCVR